MNILGHCQTFPLILQQKDRTFHTSTIELKYCVFVLFCCSNYLLDSTVNAEVDTQQNPTRDGSLHCADPFNVLLTPDGSNQQPWSRVHLHLHLKRPSHHLGCLPRSSYLVCLSKQAECARVSVRVDGRIGGGRDLGDKKPEKLETKDETDSKPK